jgi:hypothetical protein
VNDPARRKRKERKTDLGILCKGSRERNKTPLADAEIQIFILNDSIEREATLGGGRTQAVRVDFCCGGSVETVDREERQTTGCLLLFYYKRALEDDDQRKEQTSEESRESERIEGDG